MVQHQEDAKDPNTTDVVAEKDEEAYVASEDVLKGALQATDDEHAMTLMEGIRKYPKACLWSVLFSSALIMEGFDKAFVTSFFAFPPFQERYGELQETGDYQIPADVLAGVSNGVSAGQIVGLLLNGFLADWFGYRIVMISCLFLMVCFIFLQFFATSIYMYMGAGVLLGVPWGVFQTLTTTFAAEVTPNVLRPYLTMLVPMCWSIGYLLGTSTLRGFLSMEGEWAFRIPFALQWVLPIPLAIGIYFAPESPWWLVRRGRIEEAKVSLERLTVRNSEIDFKPDETISMMIHTNEMEKEAQSGTSYLDLFKGVSLRRTEIVCCTWMIQTLCGATFMGYSTYFYQQAGMAVENSFSMSLGQYAIGAVGTVFSWFLMGWAGRRTLYLYGQLAMCLFLLTIGCVAFAGRDNVAAQWAIGSLLLVYTFTYDCTVGPVCYSLVAELTSTRLRTKSVVLARNMYNIVGIVTNIITPRMLNPSAWNWGAKSGFFWAGTCFLCAIWTYFRLPEPKGRTYAELDILFEQHVSARKFKGATVERLDAGFDHGIEKEKEASAIYVEKIQSESK